jgi:hypothetical protein
MRAAVAVACLLCVPAAAVAQGRILIETASQPPDLYPEQAVLYVKRVDAVVGDCEEPAADAGTDSGSETETETETDAETDAGTDPDAGAGPDPDSGTGTGRDPDAGTDAGTGCTVIPGPAITMVVQPRFTTGPDGARFALLLATPAPPLYSVEPAYLFDQLADITAPRIEHVRVEVEDPAVGHRCSNATGCGAPASEPQGCGAGYSDDPYWDPPSVPDGGFGDGGVDVIPVGEYEVLRIPATDATSLAAWLDTFDYAYTTADIAAIEPYLTRGDTITAVRVAIDGPEDGALRPLALTWPGTDVHPPLTLARPPAGSFAELTVYISAEGRYQLPDARIAFAARTSASDAPFLTRNDLVIGADRTIERDPLATRITGDPELIPVTTVEDIVRIPVEVECDSDRDHGCCSDCNASGRTRIRWDAVFITLSAVFALRRRRKQR